MLFPADIIDVVRNAWQSPYKISGCCAPSVACESYRLSKDGAASGNANRVLAFHSFGGKFIELFPASMPDGQAAVPAAHAVFIPKSVTTASRIMIILLSCPPISELFLSDKMGGGNGGL